MAMNVQQFKDFIANGAGEKAIESAWLESMESSLSVADMASILESIATSKNGAIADTLGQMLLEEKLGAMSDEQALDAARSVFMVLPNSDALRKKVAELYQKVHGRHENFGAILAASGLTANQSPKRSTRTLDVCLAVKGGDYMANRFDHQVVKVEGFDSIENAFALIGPDGGNMTLEPKLLADEYETVGENDFRVLCQHRPDELGAMLSKDPAAVLVGICQTHGGRITADDLKDMLVPKYIEAKSWSGWWGRARTAAKKCSNLSLEGKSPVVLQYHPDGLTMEDEFSAAAESAKTPLAKLDVLQQYVRQARARKLPIADSFAGAIMESLAQQATQFRTSRPADSFAAALAIADAIADGCQPPKTPYPIANEIIASAAKPAELVFRLEEQSLLAAALKSLRSCPDAAGQFRKLFAMSPAEHLDEIAEHIYELNDAQSISQAATDAVADPVARLEICLWLWRGPRKEVAGAPTSAQLLAKIMGVVQQVAHDWQVKPDVRRNIFQRIRWALGSTDYATYRKLISQIDEAVADTIKRQIDRCEEGLAETVHDDMLKILKESFPALFFTKVKLPPWLDEAIIWTSQSALDARQAEYKDLIEVKMPANSRAIGAAAAHGDLRENSEWKFAKEEQELLRARAAKMQDELNRARVLDVNDVPADSVGIGSRVMLKRIGDGSPIELTFLGMWDSDVDNRIYSYKSQLGLELMGRKIGEKVELKIDGAEGEYKIESLANGMVK